MIYPQELSFPGQWILVGVAAAVPAQPGGDRTKWPNMWSHRQWKEKMQRVARQVACILEANDALNLSCCCLFCPDEYLSAEHLMGPKHFFKLMGREAENMPVSTDNFWQTWTFKTGTGALAFNQADGTLRMVRQPDGNELVAPASPPAPAGFSLQYAEISADQHERVLAALRVLPQPPPLPLVDEGFFIITAGDVVNLRSSSSSNAQLLVAQQARFRHGVNCHQRSMTHLQSFTPLALRSHP